MTAASYILSDTRTLLGRNLLHARRYPAMSLSSVLMPLIFLLLFRYAFGSALGAGIGGSYIDYLVLQTLAAMAILLAVAVGIGFRPHAGPLAWLAAIGLAVLLAWALTWVAMAMGLSSRAPEAASNLPLPITLLPFLGSGFVPAASMSPGLRQFAEYQPFTPISQTLRGLLLGTPVGNQWIYALAWCAGLTVAGYLAARWLFDRRAEL